VLPAPGNSPPAGVRGPWHLEGKLFDARARHAETQVKAMELAYPANTGDESARKKLDGLNAKTKSLQTKLVEMGIDPNE
jgi:hypothetical protein